MKKVYALIVAVLVVFVAYFYTMRHEIEFFEEPQEHVGDENTQVTPAEDLIHITSPESGAVISSPVTVSGEARGTWFFEASFPIFLVDWDGKIIAEGYAQAQGDWMTEEFVPFTGTLAFEKPEYGERGALIFKKDNPSGLPEHDAAVEIPILFE